MKTNDKGAIFYHFAQTLFELLQPEEDCESIKRRTRMNIECKDAPELPRTEELSFKNPSSEELKIMKWTDINLEEMKNFKEHKKDPNSQRNPFAVILEGMTRLILTQSLEADPVIPPKPSLDSFKSNTKIWGHIKGKQ